jgi:response regulator RpfG family c-di-GMP phosphodiesterase
MHTILVVDDARVNVQVYERILAQVEDSKIVGFTSSTLAMTWLLDNKPDLVITDFRMPDLDGLQLIEQFRTQPTSKGVPIVMITSSKEKEIRHKALELGVDDFLEKPADPVAFLTRSRNLLKMREQSLQLENRMDWLASEVRRATADIIKREQETIFMLTRATEHRDKETKNHIVRMGHYAQVLAQTLEMPSDYQELILLAAPMHDVGKVAIPDRILLKEGKLTADEWTIMKTHAQAGYDILKDTDSKLIHLGAEIALSHHEKYDGSGYPSGLSGNAIPLSGRICAIGDVFDALLSVRPYKPAWSLPDTIETLKRGKGNHFDPVLVDRFLEAMPALQAVRREFSDSAS